MMGNQTQHNRYLAMMAISGMFIPQIVKLPPVDPEFRRGCWMHNLDQEWVDAEYTLTIEPESNLWNINMCADHVRIMAAVLAEYN
jgi:hypothetical protein